ncbi:MAG TPA: phosphate uptake regulator PhoU [Nitrososphaerales archaeon]|nr:phosphate uptake regulator PhoU [Nitrososphaerales archaeon]
MPARKAIEMGEGTILVSLPKDWVRKYGVRKGDTLSVEELPGGKILIKPFEGGGEEPKQITIEYPGDDLSQVTNDVTGAYLLGYDVIKVVGSRVISREDRASIKSTIGRLVGLEIMDEDSKRITMQFLLEPTAIVPEKIVLRMSGLLDGMLKDMAEGLAKGDMKLLGLVGERDDEVDRLYFLLVRATRAAIVRPEVAERYGLSPVDLLDYRVLASFLESIGDAVTDLSHKFHHRASPGRLAREYSVCVSKLTAMNNLATQGFISRRAGKQMSNNRKVGALAQEIAEKLSAIAKLPTNDGAETAETLAALDRVSKLLVDVADLAVITQQVSE